MKQVPYTNTKPHAVTIGTKTIAPGDTRMVDESLLGKTAAPPKATASADPVAAFLELRANDAKAAVINLPDEELAAVAEREERKTVLAAIQEEQLERAKAAGDGEVNSAPEGNEESDGEASED